MSSSAPPAGKIVPPSFYQEFLDDESNFDDSAAVLNFSFKAAIIQLAQANILKLGSLAVVHPFESMRILRQVQYGTAVDVTEAGGFFEKTSETIGDKNEMRRRFKSQLSDSGTSNDADDEGDPLIIEKETSDHFEKSGIDSSLLRSNGSLPKVTSSPAEIDEMGYAYTSRDYQNSNSSTWPLIFNKKASLWSSFMLAAKYQGVPSLWQGIMAFWTYQSSFDLTQAIFEELLTSPILWNRPGGLLAYSFKNNTEGPDLIPYFPVIPVTASIALGAIVNFLLTPLDLVRTRLVCQSIYSSEIKCKSITRALKLIYKEEGGVAGLYPNKIFSGFTAILLPALRILPMTLFNHFADTWTSSIGLPPGLTYALVQFLFSCTNLVVTLPIETIRRRLYLQTISKKVPTPWIYRVPVSPTPYLGFWNCLRRICQEEGVPALYQGLSMQLASSTVLLASNLVLEMESEYPDDMEAF